MQAAVQPLGGDCPDDVDRLPLGRPIESYPVTMGIRVTLRYPDGAEVGKPPDIVVDALPPLGSEINILSVVFVVDQVSLMVRGNGDTYYTVRLREGTP
jgi:hypothetical protein